MVLYNLLLAPCQYLLNSNIFFWLPAYHYGTLLPSTGSMPIPMILFYRLLAPCLYILYSTIFFWLPAYPYGTLLPSTGPLPIPMVFYYLPMAPAYPLGTLLSSTGQMPILWFSNNVYISLFVIKATGPKYKHKYIV